MKVNSFNLSSACISQIGVIASPAKLSYRRHSSLTSVGRLCVLGLVFLCLCGCGFQKPRTENPHRDIGSIQAKARQIGAIEAIEIALKRLEKESPNYSMTNTDVEMVVVRINETKIVDLRGWSVSFQKIPRGPGQRIFIFVRDDRTVDVNYDF